MKTRISLLGGLAVALLAASLPRATAQQQPKSSPARPDRETTAAGPGAAEPNGAVPAQTAPAPSSTSTARPIPGANGLLPGIREERRGADSYEPNVAIADELDGAAPGALREQSQLLPLRETISPVRKPYAVQLVDPIIMIR